MKYEIIPSLIAKDQAELDFRVKKLKNHFKLVQLDIMDGDFVPETSLDFNFILPKYSYEAHLMINNPEVWTISKYKLVKTVIAQIESLKNPDEMIKIARKEKKKIYFALRPETDVSEIKPYLKKIDGVLIMTVEPGAYGAKFIPAMLLKIKELRKVTKKDIEVDGSMNPQTIKLAKQAGANRFVVGSFLQNSENLETAVKELKKALK